MAALGRSSGSAVGIFGLVVGGHQKSGNSSNQASAAGPGALCHQRGSVSLLVQHRAWARRRGAGFCMCSRDGGNAENEPSSSDSNAWDARLQSAMAGIEGLRGLVASTGKRIHQYISSYGSKDVAQALEVQQQESAIEQVETEWHRWQSFFHEIEEQENSIAVLEFDLNEAIEREEYEEASRLQKEMLTIRGSDIFNQIIADLKVALSEERYADAARIRDETGAGLIGWWAGVSEEGNDPFGKIISITSSQGRLVATGYTARQLVMATPGVPLFEVFYRKDDELGYQRQAVYLKRERADTATTSDGNEHGGSKGGKSADGSKDENKDAMDDGLNRIMKFLKGRIPDVKLKVFQVSTTDGAESDMPKITDQLKSGDDSKLGDEMGTSDEGKAALESQLQEKGGKSAVTAEELVEMSLKLLIGRLQNTPEDKLPVLPVRVPARIDHTSRDRFVFHIEDYAEDNSLAKDTAASWRVAVASQPSELTSENAMKVLSGTHPVKVSKEVADIIKLAVSYAQRRRGLAKSTCFQRIHLPSSGSDALNGLYVGPLAPHTYQVIQLRQRIGNWQEDDETADGDKFEFNHYVEAVKLVGDMHVPAGQVIFRAKTGRGCRLPHRGVYPDELGVVARYKGRGKVAEPGFKNPHWIDGELLLLDGKGGGFLNGAQLCFVYSGPGHPYLILFRRALIEDRQL